MTTSLPHRMLVVHNIVRAGGRVRTIDPTPFRKSAFGSLLAYADEVATRAGKERMLVSDSLVLPSRVWAYDKEQLQGVSVAEKYDSAMCHLVLDHGAVVSDEFFAAVRADFLKTNGVVLNPVRSIAKTDVARISQGELTTRSAPCVIKKNNNYNKPETVFEIATEAQLDAWRERHAGDEQSVYVMEKLLRYHGIDRLRMYKLERWIVLFDDLTINYRCSDDFYVKNATSLSYYVRDERCMNHDLARLAESGYRWKGRSIDCAYDDDADAWDARYLALRECRRAFQVDYAELDVIQPVKGQFVVIDVNHTPGPYYENVYWREVAVRILADRLGSSPH